MINRVKHVHFVGIGGCGMSGIAEILLKSGYKVSGSDLSQSSVTTRLQELGITVYKGHSKHNITGADVVVYSSAVKQDNPELVEAHEHHVPVLRRAEMLGQLMRMKFSVAVAGTHGKTSTTSIVGKLLSDGGFDPSIIVGGVAKRTETGAVMGASNYMVVEADEFDRSFLKMPPSIAVMTTLESEHLDCYKDLDDIKDAFVGFAEQVPFFGCTILCIDEPTLLSIIPRLRKNVVITYGFSAQADYRCVDRVFTGTGSRFKVEHRGEILGSVELNVPGDHNVKNAMAGISVAFEMGMPFEKIAQSLKSFENMRRRFEIKGEKKGIMIVDDYAHHPTEIKATLQAAKDTYGRRVIALFQPHLYTRTRDFYRDFGSSFINADMLIVTDVYASREMPIEGVSGQLVADAAIEFGHRKVKYIPDRKEILKYVKGKMVEGDVIITLGAGDIWKTGEEILEVIA
ncbi:MAG: UDP-N-acetylmuramate--L-alanine ligase [Fibrobacteres bacterium]|nr:UDP-N-acetylmuramate--L-alanine ligase [Fibrobacterota bacterium]